MDMDMDMDGVNAPAVRGGAFFLVRSIEARAHGVPPYWGPLGDTVVELHALQRDRTEAETAELPHGHILGPWGVPSAK